MERSEYIDLINKNEKCNFVAFAITPWHALGISATINKLVNNGNELNGYIFVYAYIQEKNSIQYCVNFDNFEIFNQKIQIVYTTFERENILNKIKTIYSASKYLLKNEANKKEFYVLSPSTIDLKWIDILYQCNRKKRIIFIMFDEGIGSTEFRTTHGMYVKRIAKYDGKEGILKKIKNYILAMFEHFLNCVFEKALSGKRGLVNNQLLIEYKGKIVKNKAIVNNYIEVFQKMNSYDANEYSDCLLLNPQPEIFGSEIESHEEELLFRLCSDIAVSNGAKVVIKPHPRDNNFNRFNNYGCYVESNKNVSQEILISSLEKKPRCVVSLTSTTTFTLNLFYDIPSICLAKMVYKQMPSGSRKESYRRFIDNFSDLIFMPNDIDELKTKLDNIFNEKE